MSVSLANIAPPRAALSPKMERLISREFLNDLYNKAIEYYLKADRDREIIAKSGWERAHRDHTYERRLRLLLATVDGQERGFPLPCISWDRNTNRRFPSN